MYQSSAPYGFVRLHIPFVTIGGFSRATVVVRAKVSMFSELRGSVPATHEKSVFTIAKHRHCTKPASKGRTSFRIRSRDFQSAKSLGLRSPSSKSTFRKSHTGNIPHLQYAYKNDKDSKNWRHGIIREQNHISAE